MKKLVAMRMLKRYCVYCCKGFRKGEVYYKDRIVYATFQGVIAYEHIICPKCIYKAIQQNKRFQKFKRGA